MSARQGQTRFIFRTRMRTGPLWVAAAYLLAIMPADFIMSPRCSPASKPGRNESNPGGTNKRTRPPGGTTC